ncbi:Uncharacterised protein [Salmonella enterica subsp. enterica]|nr:Uncharacterised protein [Salmonella enterica subsp. enterica]
MACDDPRIPRLIHGRKIRFIAQKNSGIQNTLTYWSPVFQHRINLRQSIRRLLKSIGVQVFPARRYTTAYYCRSPRLTNDLRHQYARYRHYLFLICFSFEWFKTATMWRRRHLCNWRKPFYPDIIPVQINRGQCDGRFCSRWPTGQSDNRL